MLFRSHAVSGVGFDAVASSVVQAVADLVVAVGPGSALIWANRAAEERIGYSNAELQGMALVELVHPDDHETAMFSLASVVTKEYGTLLEIRVRDSSGQYAWFERSEEPTAELQSIMR